MPSRLRAADDHAALVLTTNHVLAITNNTGAHIYVDANTLTYPIDVLAAPDLALSLSGTCDRVKIPPKVVAQSHIANHLVQYLRMNAAQLGLDYVSAIIHDQKDNKPKLIIRPGHLSLQLQRLPACATLVELDLAYIWQTSTRQKDANVSPLTNPFAQNLSLPYQTLLDAVVERFVNRDLVKRYPLIFGPWRRQLEIEAPFFPTIYRSIRCIVDRSPNPAFKGKCDQLFMILRENMLSAAAVSAASISNTLPDCDFSGADMSMSELDALCLAMERLFQAGMQLPKYKGLNRGVVPDRIDDEELSQKMSQCPPDRIQEPSLWELHSEDYLNSTSNSMDKPLRSSYEYRLFGLYEPHLFQTEAHQNKISRDIGLELSTSESHDALAWDSDEELWGDGDHSSTVNGTFFPSTPERHLNGIPNTINFKSSKGYCQQNGDIIRPNANQGHLSQPPDLCEALTAEDDIDFYHPMKGWPADESGKDFADESVFTIEEKIEDQDDDANDWPSGALQRCNQWAIDNLFAHENKNGTEGGGEAVVNVPDHDIYGHKIPGKDDDIDLLSEGSPNSTSSILSLNGDLDEDVTHNVARSISSRRHFSLTSFIPSASCSRADRR